MYCSRQFINRTDFLTVLSLYNTVHSQQWGFVMKYKKIALLPNLAISNFALETPDGRITVKKWKDAPFTVEDFSFEEYCQDNFPDIFDWNTNKRTLCGIYLTSHMSFICIFHSSLLVLNWLCSFREAIIVNSIIHSKHVSIYLWWWTLGG